MTSVVTRFIRSFLNFLNGRAGIYRSFFVISPLLLLGTYIFLLVAGFFWSLRPEQSYDDLVTPIFALFILLLTPFLTTTGVVGSVFRTLASKHTRFLHKIFGAFIFLTVLFAWVMYSELIFMPSYDRVWFQLFT